MYEDFRPGSKIRKIRTFWGGIRKIRKIRMTGTPDTANELIALHTSTSKDKISIRQELLRVVACRAARLRLT